MGRFWSDDGVGGHILREDGDSLGGAYIAHVDPGGWCVWTAVQFVDPLDEGPETGRTGRRVALRRAVELGVIPEAEAREVDDPEGGKTWALDGGQPGVDRANGSREWQDGFDRGYAAAIADVAAYLDAEANRAPSDRDGDVLREAVARIDAGDATGAAND